MQSEDDKLREFCNNHRIRVLDTNKRFARQKFVQASYFSDVYDYNKLQTILSYDTEALWTVEVSESELKRMASFESEVFNNMRKQGHYDMFNYVMNQKEQEKNLRDRYPAVKKAYEHYSLILKMAQAGEYDKE